MKFNTLHSVIWRHINENPIPLQSSKLPFDITLGSTDSFTVFDTGYNYSHAGIIIYLERNELSQLLGGFFVPMGIFKLLSMISFHMNPEAVSTSITRAWIYGAESALCSNMSDLLSDSLWSETLSAPSIYVHTLKDFTKSI